MIIPTLGNGQLYEVHRTKPAMLIAIQKRKALFLTCCITAVVTFGVIMFLVRS
jgi:hypothetical protein